MSFSVNVQTEVTLQQIADLVVTALEGGSNYWLDRVTPVFMSHKDYSEADKYGPEMLERTFYAEDDDTPYLFNRAQIDLGLQILANEFPSHFGDIVNDNVDADTGDAFLQCVLFGELVYG